MTLSDHSASDPSDEALIQRYAAGDAAAFETLYLRHEMRVWRYLLRQTRNEASADELMQETWFAVARDAGRYVPSHAARFTTWLFTIAHHRLIDALRASRPAASLDELGHEAPDVVEHLTAPPTAGPIAAVIARDQSQAIRLALDRLPREQREAFLLQVEGDLSVEEIAGITRTGFETVKSRLRYARSTLRDLLEDYA
jgi:RNA polymerase sigma-70 factor (ECF subfamily)